jgi:hypothetical protein
MPGAVQGAETNSALPTECTLKRERQQLTRNYEGGEEEDVKCIIRSPELHPGFRESLGGNEV